MSKAPKLRFKEFSGDWESKKFKDIVKINQGLQIAISDRYTEDGENRLFYITNEFLKKESGKKYYIENPPSSVICKESDILMTRTGNTGQVVTGVSGAFHNNFFKINYDSSSHNKMFLYYILTSFKIQKSIIRLAGTSTIPDLNHGDFYNIRISYPSIEEQEKIAHFFSLIDDKISLQGEKVEALKDYKRGMMQKIFSRELRFKDDEGRDYPEWEEKKLGDCIENKGGTALEKFVDENGTHKFISIGNYSTSGKYIDSGQRISLNDKTKDKLLYKNDLVMVLNDKTATGDLIGSTILIDEDNTYIYNQRSERLICNENINPDFAWILLNYEDFRKKVFSIAQGGTQIYVNFPSVKNLNIQLPSLKEQNKISELILALDNKIEKEQEKLDSLNEYKKGLLQQMFV